MGSKRPIVCLEKLPNRYTLMQGEAGFENRDEAETKEEV